MSTTQAQQALNERREHIVRELAGLGDVQSGSLAKRYRRCGKPTCHLLAAQGLEAAFALCHYPCPAPSPVSRSARATSCNNVRVVTDGREDRDTAYRRNARDAAAVPKTRAMRHASPGAGRRIPLPPCTDGRAAASSVAR